MVFKNVLVGGIGDNYPVHKLNKTQLSMGVREELEHTSNKEIAKEIAIDHLSQDKNYYLKLHKYIDKKLSKSATLYRGYTNSGTVVDIAKGKKASDPMTYPTVPMYKYKFLEDVGVDSEGFSNSYKEGSLIGLAAIGTHAFGTHIAQNVASDIALSKSKTTHNLLHQSFHSGIQQSNPSRMSQIAIGLHSAITPEVGIVAKELNHFGRHLETFLGKQGLSYHKLSDTQHNYLKAIMSGNVDTLKQLHSHPEVQVVKYSIHNYPGESFKPVKDMLNTLEHNPVKAMDLSEQYKKTSFSKFLPTVVAKPTSKIQTSNNKNTGLAGEALGNMALAAVDPISAISNVSKRVATSSWLGERFPMIGKAQKNISNSMIVNPAQRLLSSATSAPGQVISLGRKYLQNPIIGDIKNLSQSFGAAKKRVIIPQELS